MTKIKKYQYRGGEIWLGYCILNNIKTFIQTYNYSKIILITVNKLYNLWNKKLDENLMFDDKILLQTGEQTKSIESVEYICKKFVDFAVDRKSLIINFGGGMITDLGGFCASIYMRGVDYINIPTSLLAMVDASVGGKNGINFCDIKNIIGAFNKPKMVLIDTQFLQTLPKRELNSAYGEIVKHAIIASEKYFHFLENWKKNSQKNDENLLKIIDFSLKIKKNFADKDFKESGKRKILNFGHTIGHAIEAISIALEEPFLHGEAVLSGMFFETQIAVEIGLLKKNEAEKIYDCLHIYGLGELLEKMKKNRNFFKIDEIIKKMKKDKKNENSSIKFVLPIRIGRCKYDISVSEKQIIKILNVYIYGE